jgi:hypothetical protein
VNSNTLSQYHVHRLALVVFVSGYKSSYGKWQNCISSISKSADSCGNEISNVRSIVAVNTTSTVIGSYILKFRFNIISPNHWK